LPFGMIFAVFLIVVFVVVAFIAVKHFLNVGGTARIGQFVQDFQEQVDSAWSGQASEFTFKPDLPDIEKICFANLSKSITRPLDYKEIPIHEDEGHNLFLIPASKAKGFERNTIEHLDVAKITERANPYCVDATRDLTIKKGFYDRLVVVE